MAVLGGGRLPGGCWGGSRGGRLSWGVGWVSGWRRALCGAASRGKGRSCVASLRDGCATLDREPLAAPGHHPGGRAGKMPCPQCARRCYLIKGWAVMIGVCVHSGPDMGLSAQNWRSWSGLCPVWRVSGFMIVVCEAPGTVAVVIASQLAIMKRAP